MNNVWLMLLLSCGHVGGCDIQAKVYPTRAECESAMTVTGQRWSGNWYKTYSEYNPRAICFPIAELPIIPAPPGGDDD